MELLDTGNLRISWDTYAGHSLFHFCRYFIYNHGNSGLDCFLFLGPLELRWWKPMNYTISRAAYFKAMETYLELANSLPSNLQEAAPPFHSYLEAVTPKGPLYTPFQHNRHDPLWVELTEEGFQRMERLSNPHAITLLAVWIAQHGS